MPADDRINVRSSLRAMPEDTRPDLRWYTVRAHRPEVAEIDVDFVVHGDAGPGTRCAIEPSMTISVRGPETSNAEFACRPARMAFGHSR